MIQSGEINNKIIRNQTFTLETEPPPFNNVTNNYYKSIVFEEVVDYMTGNISNGDEYYVNYEIKNDQSIQIFTGYDPNVNISLYAMVNTSSNLFGTHNLDEIYTFMTTNNLTMAAIEARAQIIGQTTERMKSRIYTTYMNGLNNIEQNIQLNEIYTIYFCSVETDNIRFFKTEVLIN